MRKTKVVLEEELTTETNNVKELVEVLQQANEKLKELRETNVRQDKILHLLVDLISGKATKLS